MSKIGRLLVLAVWALAPLFADAAEPALLFRVSADHGFAADEARGDPVPNFQEKVKIVPTGKFGGAIEWADDGVLTWHAPGNIYTQRGTLSFFWRSRTPVGVAPFVLFRVGYADHTSWDMCWLRIDWNGHGFDAFVTDANLARTRVSFKIDKPPAPDAWTHIAFSWDETVGIRLALNGKEVARQDVVMDLDSGLDQFGLAARVVSPHQVQSRYSFLRGSDYDEIRIYDQMLDVAGVKALARNAAPKTAVQPDLRQAWLRRWGWDGGQSPPLLTAPSTKIRKVEFADSKDKLQWMYKATDGIQETTWPGVYNRSRLPGRHDYFELPDWLTYVEGGQKLDLTLPDESFNRVELRGAAFGALSYAPPGGEYRSLADRAKGTLRSITTFDRLKGGKLRFTNVEQETPIQEIWAYDVSDGKEPDGTLKLSYVIHADAAPDYDNIAALRRFIDGRYPWSERATVVALPNGAAMRKHGPESAAREPIVHVLIPSGFADPAAEQPLTRSWAYGWENIHDGLDGIAIDLPALSVTPNASGVIPLNIQVKDPIWPERDMIDVSVSVPPGQPRTVWLDLRDRILTNDSFYLTIASAAPDFGAASVDGAKIRLVFKDRTKAKIEHVADRFNQVKDNWGYLTEEHTASKRERLYLRCFTDIADLLRVDPEHEQGRYYWSEMSYNNQGWPPFKQPDAPAGAPLWAFRQLEDLKLVRHFVNWWIDNRQVPFGDFGGGISDDTDLLQQWPGLALMGVDSDKIKASHDALVEAVYKDNMFTNGLATIVTDELHAYEDGINSNSQSLYLNWGKPKTVERLMETARALHRVIMPNPAGNVLFASNWYSGTTIYREGPWEWQKPYSFTVVHPAILLGMYNGQPDSRALVTGLADGYLAHAKLGKDGVTTYPNEINWRTDEERGGELLQGSGEGTPMQTFWAAYRWSSDPKYLGPILYRIARKGESSILDLNENVIDVVGRREDWGRKLTERAAQRPGGFEQYVAWEMTGDKKWLESMHAHGIQEKTQRMYMTTEGHWWIDRVEARSDLLQRERLGGIALERGWLYPGHSVSWRFADPEGGVQVAILLPGATRDHLKVIAYNMSDKPQAARMTGWNVTAGTWTMTSGIDGSGSDKADRDVTSRKVTLERSAAVDVSFAPHQTTVLEFQLDSPTTPVEARPDLGIGPDDVSVAAGTVSVTVHSLGSVAVPGGKISLIDAGGKVLASAALPPIAAPLDLLPKTVDVKLAVPAGAALTGAKVKVALRDDAPEVTLLNNEVALP